MAAPTEPLTSWNPFHGLIKYLSTFRVSNNHATEPGHEEKCHNKIDCESLQCLPSISRNTFDQVYITDNDEMYQWASKDTYMFSLFKFLQKFKCLQFFLDGMVTINPCWLSVLKLDEVLNKNEPIEITDTLILHCASIETYSKVIPLIRGPYNRLILHGHTTWDQIKQLYHPGVKQFRINATFEMTPNQHDEFIKFVKNHCRGRDNKTRYQLCAFYCTIFPSILAVIVYLILSYLTNIDEPGVDRSGPLSMLVFAAFVMSASKSDHPSEQVVTVGGISSKMSVVRSGKNKVRDVMKRMRDSKAAKAAEASVDPGPPKKRPTTVEREEVLDNEELRDATTNAEEEPSNYPQKGGFAKHKKRQAMLSKVATMRSFIGTAPDTSSQMSDARIHDTSTSMAVPELPESSNEHNASEAVPELPKSSYGRNASELPFIPACKSNSYPQMATEFVQSKIKTLHDTIVALGNQLKAQQQPSEGHSATGSARKAFEDLGPRQRQRVNKRFDAELTAFCERYLIDDKTEYLNQFLRKADSQQLSAIQTLQLQTELRFSGNTMDKLRRILRLSGCNVLASKRAVKKLTADLPLKLSKKTVKNCTLVMVDNIKQCLETFLNALLDQGIPVKEEVPLCAVSDKGGSSTKIAVLIGPSKSRNSPRSTFLIAMYDGEENRECLEAAFHQFKTELCGSDTTITLKDGITRQLVVSQTGDLKLLKILYGHRAATRGSTCFFCLAPYESTISATIDRGAGIRRKLEKNEAVMQDYEPVLPIPYNMVFLPTLHLIMGITSIIIDASIAAVWKCERRVKKLPEVPLEEISTKPERKKYADLEEALTDIAKNVEAWNNIKQQLHSTEEGQQEGNGSDDVFVCEASNCIGRILGINLPSRIGKAANVLKSFKKAEFHTICAGLSVKQATNGLKWKKWNPKEASISSIVDAIIDEVTNCEKAMSTLENQQDRLESQIRERIDNIRRLSAWVNTLFKAFEKVGAYQSAWFQAFTGGHVRKLLVKAPSIRQHLKAEDGTSLCNYPEINAGITALELLGKIQDYTVADVLDPDQIARMKVCIERFKDHLKTHFGDIAPGHKLHILLNHMAEFADEHDTIGFFSEQSIESCHADVNAMSRRFCYHDFGQQASAIMREFFNRCYCYRLLMAKKKRQRFQQLSQKRWAKRESRKKENKENTGAAKPTSEHDQCADPKPSVSPRKSSSDDSGF
uniref:ULP_PROTEASE domain-containing protein n=1 Tax=Panagrellus redivivus TaxID=6233 RepID=A0A7E4W533_PANRE